MATNRVLCRVKFEYFSGTPRPRSPRTPIPLAVTNDSRARVPIWPPLNSLFHPRSHTPLRSAPKILRQLQTTSLSTSSKTTRRCSPSTSSSADGKFIPFLTGLRFEGLSVAERVNCLTTTYPSLVSKLIEAHFEMRDNGVLSLFKKHTSVAQNIYAM